LHEDDLIGVLLKQKNSNAKYYCLPAELTDDVYPENMRSIYRDGLLDPVRMPKTSLDDLRQQDSITYATQYLLTPMSDDAALFKKENMQYCSIENGYIEVQNKQVSERQLTRFFTIDLATSIKETADFTVLSYWGIDRDNNLYLIDCFRERVEGYKHKEIVNNFYERYRPDFVGVEAVAYQSTLVQELVRAGLPAVALKPDRDKRSRAIPAAARHQNKTIYFNRELNCLTDIELELTRFPNSKHDDFVDTLSYAVQYLTEQTFTDFYTYDYKESKNNNQPDYELFTRGL